jgi:hypothetical protein
MSIFEHFQVLQENIAVSTPMLHKTAGNFPQIPVEQGL